MGKIIKKENTKLALWGVITGFCNGLFGSGGGMIAVPVLQKVANLDAKKSHATAIGVILPLTLVSIFKYSSFCKPNVKTLLVVCAGGIIGSIAGAVFFKRFSALALRRIFGIVIITTAIRMVVL